MAIQKNLERLHRAVCDMTERRRHTNNPPLGDGSCLVGSALHSSLRRRNVLRFSAAQLRVKRLGLLSLLLVVLEEVTGPRFTSPLTLL